MKEGRTRRWWNAVRETFSPVPEEGPQQHYTAEERAMRDKRQLWRMLNSVPEEDAGNCSLEFSSSDQRMPFQVSFRVLYRDTADRGSRGSSAAIDAVRNRIAAISAKYALLQREHFQIALDAWLTECRQTEMQGVWAKAAELTVEVDEYLEQAAKARDELWRRTQLHRWRWEQEVAQTRHARDLLADPARAAAWWLARHPDDVDRLPGVCEAFVNAHDRVSGQPVADDEGLSTLVTRLWEASEPHARSGLLKTVHDFAAAYGHVSLAADIEGLFEAEAS